LIDFSPFVFSTRFDARFQAASIMQGSNGLQPPLNAIKIEAPSYYCNSYTPPAPDHSASMLQAAGAYSKLFPNFDFIIDKF
jgi:nuclear factor I